MVIPVLRSFIFVKLPAPIAVYGTQGGRRRGAPYKRSDRRLP